MVCQRELLREGAPEEPEGGWLEGWKDRKELEGRRTGGMEVLEGTETSEGVEGPEAEAEGLEAPEMPETGVPLTNPLEISECSRPEMSHWFLLEAIESAVQTTINRC